MIRSRRGPAALLCALSLTGLALSAGTPTASAAGSTATAPGPTSASGATASDRGTATTAAGRAAVAAQTKALHQAVAAGTLPPNPVGCDLGEISANRTLSCVMTEGDFTVDNAVGKPVGSAEYSATSLVQLDPRSRTWKEYVVVSLREVTGAARSLRVQAEATFPDGPGFTTTMSRAVGLGPIDPTDNSTVNATVIDFTVTSPGKKLVQGRVDPLLELEPTDPTAQGPQFIQLQWNGNGPAVRCDSLPGVGTSPSGCVYPWFQPTYTLDTGIADTSAVASHVLTAQRTLQHPWGVYGVGTYPLTYTSDKATIAANTKAACAGLPTQKGLACDQFPFADTKEGAEANPDFSAVLLDARQHRLEQTTYRDPWYKQNRMLTGDTYWVNVECSPAPECPPPS